MFERFTDRARKAMALANQAALGFNHDYIDTEHILLGLVKDGSGVGTTVLKALNIDLPTVRLEVERLVKNGPDVITMGKPRPAPSAEKVIEYAIAEARNLGHDHVGTAHLLLGLIQESDGIAAQVLMNLGLKVEDVRKEVLKLVGTEAITEDLHNGEWTDQFSQRMETKTLLRLLKTSQITRQALLNLKVDPADIEREVRRLMDGPA